MQEIDQIIRNRRAIYPNNYTAQKISDAVIMQVLESANWAPNHKKTEPWRFKIFTDKALARLADFLAEAYKEKVGPENFSEFKYNKTRKKPMQCSHVIAIIMQRHPEEILPEWEEIAAVAMAVQNMWLSCSTKQIGCYWSSPSTITKDTEFLSLEKGQRCLGLFYMGMEEEGFEKTSKRGDIGEKVSWVRE